MKDSTRQYNVLIFSCSEVGDTPNAAVHMEIAGSFEAFHELAGNWIRGFSEAKQPDHDNKLRIRIGDGEREDIYAFCKEEEIILSLLYCCDRSGITVREIRYQGNQYTDISDIKVLKDSPDTVYDDGSYTYSIQLHAKKNRQDVQVYLFGPYIRDFNCEMVQIGRYPVSCGMVEVTANRIYAGAHPYDRYDCCWNTERTDDESPVQAEEDVHVFLETEGENITFSALLDGELRKKISRDQEKIVFYSVLSNDKILTSQSRFWQRQDPGNIVFKNINGVYQLYLREDVDMVDEFPDLEDEYLSVIFQDSEDADFSNDRLDLEDADLSDDELDLEDADFSDDELDPEDKGLSGGCFGSLAEAIAFCEKGYREGNKFFSRGVPGDTFVPPQTPDAGSLNQDSAYRLCQDYVDRFYAGSRNVPDRGEDGTGERFQNSREHDDAYDTRNCAVHSGETAIWEAFRDILADIHDKYGLQKDKEERPEDESVRPAEILYAASIFFSLEKEELNRFLTTEKLWEDYESLKYIAQNILNEKADPDRLVFSQMRKFFAYDFLYFNQFFSHAPFVRDADTLPGPIGMDMEVKAGQSPGYNVILTMVELAGHMLCRDGKNNKKTDFLYAVNYYQKKNKGLSSEKEGGLSSKKSIGTLLSRRKDLRERLKEKVKGQDMAVDKFVDGYVRYQIRGKVPGKTAGLYLFAGPPGTGKTYLAEVFVELMAGEGYQYRRFDMAAYSGSGDTVTELVGFARTWRSSQPGQLTGFVRENPRCVLLFDEIEKASPQIRYLFLSVLEGAVLTDRYYDEPVSFEDAILIFTTNEGKDLYEDNRGTNLTAMSDPAVMDGLAASKFVPELISRFMSGTIIMFNHLSYYNMTYIFKSSVDAAVDQIRRNCSDFEFQYENELPKLYLLSKGDNIDARFVSTNAKKMAEDYFLEAMEYVKKQDPGSLKKLREVHVSVEVTDEVREYFEMTQKPRILGYAKRCAAVYTGMPVGRRGRLAPEMGVKELCQTVDYDWADSRKSFKESLRNCNWNSRDRMDRYDAVLIDLDGSPEGGHTDYDTSEGYACLKAAVEENREIPIIVVDRGVIEQKTSLLVPGVTDFVKGALYSPQCADGNIPDIVGQEGRERESLVLDGKELKAILDRQHFVEMAAVLARKNQRLSGDAVYDHDKESGKLEVRFTNLRVRPATEEDAEDRRQNRKYLLADKPQVRLDDIYGNELVKKAVRRCIDNIKNPEKYRESGARLMRGILMYGAPGMGKTMFAKAMAYESRASFISRAGADFLNGNGVDKMEEVFRTARRKKPCILFIDEFDAISQIRGGRITNYQEIVLEKFLKEMDGLDADNEGVYVVGATNYPLERLDGAVTRRFSARIHFPDPDKEERLDFLLHLLEKKGLTDRISERDARTLNLMMSGKMRNFGEIKMFIEESIAEAVFEGRTVTRRFLFNRIHDETDGAVRQKKEINQTESMLVAFHEAGHAVLQYLFGRENEYVTIVPRRDYGGYAMAQSRYRTGRDFLEHICICFAGRAAEMCALELTAGMDSEAGVNVGAGSDLQKATRIAYDYVCRYGMGGRFMVVPEAFTPLDGRPEDVLPEAEKEAIWTSVKQILEEQWEYTRQQLQKYWGMVRALAVSLVYMQALDGETVKKIIESRIPYVEEGCFLDHDQDYVKVTTDNTKIKIPFGYPVYPYSEIKRPLEEEEAEGADGRHYFYAVKKGIESLGLYEDLQEAFTKAYTSGANCRRFEKEEAARAYLEMLELKAFRQGEKRSWGVSVDGLTEMNASNAAEKRLSVLKGEEIDRYQEQADEAGIPLAQYLIESIEAELDKKEDFYMVTQIYDEELKAEVLGYLCIRGFDEVISQTSGL